MPASLMDYFEQKGYKFFASNDLRGTYSLGRKQYHEIVFRSIDHLWRFYHRLCIMDNLAHMFDPS